MNEFFFPDLRLTPASPNWFIEGATPRGCISLRAFPQEQISIKAIVSETLPPYVWVFFVSHWRRHWPTEAAQLPSYDRSSMMSRFEMTAVISLSTVWITRQRVFNTLFLFRSKKKKKKGKEKGDHSMAVEGRIFSSHCRRKSANFHDHHHPPVLPKQSMYRAQVIDWYVYI